MSDLDLTVTKTIPAPIQRVFEAWLQPEALKRFMTPGEGMTVPKAEVDPREGGSFLIVMKAGDQEMPHNGEYRTIDRHRRLAFTWRSGYTTEDSLVTIDFKELSATETEITLHHVGFPHVESRDNHRGGWSAILAQLSRTLG
ncbi:SRPBCC family protein [Haliangium sp.]|uniref:SRPBCC family protein n=1 Tax=Haliangium sp. TaxID=2663208 RepID=UPI003D0A2669